MERIQTLEMRGVTRRYTSTTALNNFNLMINGGSFVTLLGPSGCGKSTALNCLAGLLELTEGEILLNERPVQHIPAEKRGFGMVFQNYALFPHLTVARNVGYGLEIRGVSKAERSWRVEHTLKRVHLEEFGKRYPAQLSGGQQQRLAIARTIVLEPGLLLLDEPLSNLDAKLRGEMRIEIKRLHEQLGLTTVYVTHDQSEAMSLSDKVVVMRLGQIEQVGTPQEIFMHPISLYVADFMGYANRLPLTLVGREGDLLVVETDRGISLRAVSTQPESSQWSAGQRFVGCFRPDDVRITSEAQLNGLSGHVQLIEYLGTSFEVLVRLNGDSQGEFLIHTQQAVAVHEPVTFTVPPERLLVFPLSEESSPRQFNSAMAGSVEPALKGER